MAFDSSIINFSNELSSGSLSTELELDSDYHISLYGSEKSSFTKNELVYLKIKPIYTLEPYTIQTSEGTCVKNSQGNIKEFIEFLSFLNTTYEYLSQEPIGNVSTEWTVGNGGSVLKDGKIMSINSPTLGILKCTYNVYFDRLKLTTPSNFTGTEILVIAGSELYGYSNLSITYYDEDSGEGTGVITDISLMVKDIMTDNVISGATVIISKSGIILYTGTSDSSGQVAVIGICVTGETYDVKTTAPLYFGSDEDYLNNDSFTVPAG